MNTAHKRNDSGQALHTSTMLRRFLEQHEGDEICLRELLEALGERSFGSTLLICALPEALPLPVAGISAVVGIPLMLVAAQLVLGFRQPRLPRKIVERRFKRQRIERLLNALPQLERLERLFRPRWRWCSHPLTERLLGVLVLLLALVVALPIPFGNMLPALAIVLICLGMIEQDGVAIALSVVIAGAVFVFLGSIVIRYTPLSQLWQQLWQQR